MKKLTALTLFAVVLTALIVSCKKNVTSLFYDQPELSKNIQWAKDYYNTNLQQKENYKLNPVASSDGMVGEKNPKLSNSKKPDWEKSTAGSTLIYNYVEVPLNYKNKVSFTFGVSKSPSSATVPNPTIIKATFDRLIIYKNKRGKVNQRIVSFIPDADYLAKHNNGITHNRIDNLDKDFSGYLHYKNWEGNALFVLRIEKGRPVRKYDLQNSIKRNQDTSASSTSRNKVMVGQSGETPKCYWITWEWYQDCYTLPEAPDFEFCDPPVIIDVQYLEVACPPDPGGGGGGPNYPDLPPDECLGVLVFETGECTEESDEPDPLDSIIKDTCLNASQMNTLRTMFSDYLDGQGIDELECAQKAIYNKVKALGKKIGVCIDSAKVATGNGVYNPASGNIYYKFEEGLPHVGLFSHEFFHSFQDAFYTGGIAQYNTGTRTGYPNIEFEQALFYDIINGSSDANAMGTGADPLIVSEYQTWISSITNNNTIYPKQFSDFGGQYYYFLNKFHQNAFGYNAGLVKTDLPPNALLNIFSSSNCK